VSSLYPFERTVASGADAAAIIEQINQITSAVASAVDQQGAACHTGDHSCFDADVLLT